MSEPRTVQLSEAEALALRALQSAIAKGQHEFNGALQLLVVTHGIKTGRVTTTPDCTALIVEE